MKKFLMILSFIVLSSISSFAQTFSATASWGAVTTYTDGSSATGIKYNIYRALSNTGTGEIKLNSVPISTTAYTDGTGTVNTNYFYRVSAVSTANVEGAKTAYVPFSVSAPLVPSAPTNLTVTP